MTAQRPIQLAPDFREKVWGATHLAPWFPSPPAAAGRQIGEVWFTANRSLPILVKFLFTSEKLSVQVHPDGECGVGKTEMWYILRAEPGARIALGFREPMGAERARQAALSGEIERLLNWVPVQKGEAYFTPAGTVHAIGAGLALCEIQQNSDITYRLYDYGRARELHVDQALAAANFQPHPGASLQRPQPDGWTRLVECPYFITDSLQLSGEFEYKPHATSFELLICVEGGGTFAGAPLEAGQVWLLPEGAAPQKIRAASPLRLLRTRPPASTNP